MESSRATQPGYLLENRFILVKKLGGGGAATVWLGRDMETNADVAVKLIHPKFRRDDTGLQLIMKEAEAMSALSHPSIARVLNVALNKAQPHMVLEYVEGSTLSNELGRRSEGRVYFEREAVLALFSELCGAVQHAADRGVVHRDLKPSNIMVRTEGEPPLVKVLDFGVAKLLDRSAHMATTEGRVAGSVNYMSPEQALGTGVDTRSDVFALGVVLYEVLTLRRAWLRDEQDQPALAYVDSIPLTGSNHPFALLDRIGKGPRPSVLAQRSDVPSEVDAVVAKATHPQRDERFTSARELHVALSRAFGVEADDTDSWRAPPGSRPPSLFRPSSVSDEPQTVVGTAIKMREASLREPSLPPPIQTVTSPMAFQISQSPAPSSRKTALVFGAGLGVGAAMVALAGLMLLSRPADGPAQTKLITPEPQLVPVAAPEVRQAHSEPVPPSSPAPAPASLPRSVPRPRPAAAAADVGEPPKPASPAPLDDQARLAAELRGLVERTRANPSDGTSFKALRDRLTREARQVADEGQRNRINRLVATSAGLGDVDTLAKACEELIAARGRR